MPCTENHNRQSKEAKACNAVFKLPNADAGGDVGDTAETAEETGYDVTSIRFLTTIICTPGYCEERIHIYFAELFETAHGQDQDPDENVYPVILSEAEVEDGIRNGTIFDAKTLAAWACYKLAR